MRNNILARIAIPVIAATLILSAAAGHAQAPLRDDNAYERIPQLLGTFDGVFDGRVLYVSDVINSTGSSNARGQFPSSAYATIDEAIDRVAALRSSGVLATTDLVEIRVLPGHTGSEAVVDANLFDADIPNLYIRGYGTGSQRPKLTLSDDGAELVFDAANITFENFIVEQGVTALAQAISVTANADNLTLKDIEFTKSGTLATDTVDWINVAAGADDLTLDGIVARFATTGTVSVTMVEFAGANARPTIKNCRTTVAFSDAAIDGDGIWSDATFLNNSFANAVTAFARTSGSTEYTDHGTPDGLPWNFIYMQTDLAAAPWVDQATNEVFTVTGDVRFNLLIFASETGADTTTNTATVAFGSASGTAGTDIIAATQVDDFAAGEYWNDATPTSTLAGADLDTAFLDFVALDGVDYGILNAGEPATAGILEWHAFYKPVLDGGTVAAGAGGTL